MNDQSPLEITTRKEPKQARSTGLVAAVLEAASRVLVEEGAQRFTTARVAQKAGVSIGSLYQYFPNKASILFRLQSDEWERTADLLRTILDQPATPPLARLRRLVHAFIESECDEAATRVALDDAAPLYRHAPESKAAVRRGGLIILSFIDEVLPKASAQDRVLVANLIGDTLTQAGKKFSERPRSSDEIAAYADAMADMFCAYVRSAGGA